MSEKKTHQTHFTVPEMPHKKKDANASKKKTWVEKLMIKIRQLLSGKSS